MIAAARQQAPHGGGPRQRQRGVALLIALIMLLILTVGGVTSMRNSTMQERMAGNMRDRELAFQAAERALRAGEAYLNSFNSTPSPSDDAWFHTEGNAPAWDGVDCSSGNVQSVSVDSADGACYFVEEILSASGGSGISVPGQPTQQKRLYRVTASASGLTGRTRVVLRSSYRW